MQTAKIKPSWIIAAERVQSVNAELGTLRQEKRRTAWFTCEYCPQPYRWLEDSAAIVIGTANSPRVPGDDRKVKWQWLGIKRCKPCARKRARHHRAKRDLGKLLEKQMETMGSSARFVTLTEPNRRVEFQDGVLDEQAMANEVRRFKKQIYDFTRRKEWEQKVVGAVSFIEQTYTIDEDGVDVNTHAHLVMLGKYWKQKDLQSAWGHGIVDISKPKSRHRVMKYISKYVTKDDVKGVRCKEKYGVMREKLPR